MTTRTSFEHQPSADSIGDAPLRSAPAPGEVASRDQSTEDQYRKRAHWFIQRTSRELSVKIPSPSVVAAHAIELRTGWSSSTWRVIKASLVFHFEQLGTSDSLAAADTLRSVSQTGCTKNTNRTSARRAKSYTPGRLEQVIARIGATGSEFAGVLTSWILLGSVVGLRPHEWGQAELIYGRLESKGDGSGPVEAVGPGPVVPLLRVRNAKATNGRAHGEFRHLALDTVQPEVVEMIGMFADMMREVVAAGEYQRVYSGASKLLYRVNSELHAGDSQRWIQLYSPRHRFSAEAKLAFSKEEAAALLGHATNKTAGKHYGRRNTASGGLGVRPLGQEVARVRQVISSSRPVGPAPTAGHIPSARGPKAR